MDQVVNHHADAPTIDGGAQYHIRLARGQIPPFVLVPGDPARIDKIKHFWDEPEDLAFYREYRSARGRYRGIAVGAVSTGIGMSSAEIGLQELAAIGTHTVIKVGTTGSLVAEIPCGDLIVPVAGIRRDGVSQLYVPSEFPAFAHPLVFRALVKACITLGFRYHIGLVCSSASFYFGQARPMHGGFWQSGQDHLIEDLLRMRVTNFDMESAGIMVISHLMGVRAGSIVSVMANRATNEWGDNGGEERACQAACEAVKILSEWDQLEGNGAYG